MDAADDYSRRLRDVFDLCDIDKRGYISIDHFVQLANEHFGTSGWDSDKQQEVSFYVLYTTTALPLARSDETPHRPHRPHRQRNCCRKSTN